MKKILTAIAALVLCGTMYAQIDPTVEVSRQYKVNVADIERPQTSDNAVPDSLQKFDVGFDYSIFDRPYTDLYEFSPYQTDSISKVTHRRPPIIMLQAGSQFPLAPELMLKSQLVTRPKLNIGLDADIKAAACALDYLGRPKALVAGRFQSDLSTNLKHAWNTGELTLNLGYKADAYADTYMDNSLSHGINSFGVGFNICSANPKPGEVFYNVDFGLVTAAKALTGLAEVDTTYDNSKMSIRATIGSSFDLHRIYVDLIYQNAVSGSGENKTNVGLLEFVPTYEYAKHFLKLRAGARFGNKYIGQEAEGHTLRRQRAQLPGGLYLRCALALQWPEGFRNPGVGRHRDTQSGEQDLHREHHRRPLCAVSVYCLQQLQQQDAVLHGLCADRPADSAARVF